MSCCWAAWMEHYRNRFALDNSTREKSLDSRHVTPNPPRFTTEQVWRSVAVYETGSVKIGKKGTPKGALLSQTIRITKP